MAADSEENCAPADQTRPQECYGDTEIAAAASLLFGCNLTRAYRGLAGYLPLLENEVVNVNRTLEAAHLQESTLNSEMIIAFIQGHYHFQASA